MFDICECGATATHAKPVVCDRCWAKRFSTQFIDGEYLPYAEAFKKSIGDMGKKDEETREAWFKRCENFIKEKGYANSVIKSKGAKVATKGS